NISAIVVDVTGEPGPSSPPVPADVEADDDAQPAKSAATALAVVEPPVGLASPDGSPPVGGRGGVDAAPTDQRPVPLPGRPPHPPPASIAHPQPRRVTLRSVLFVLAVLAVLGIAVGGITYYGRSGYYVGFVGDQVAVFKGQKGGVLWVKPTVDGTYPLHRADLTAAWQQRLDDTITFTSRASADAWFDTLKANPAAVPGLTNTTVSVPTTTPTAAPPETAPGEIPTDLTSTTVVGP